MSTSSTRRPPLAVDLDGTVLDPRPRQLAVLASLLESERTSGPVDLDRLWELKREGSTTEAALVALGVSDQAAGGLARRWAAEVEDPRWLRLDRPLPGAAETLRELAQSVGPPVLLTARRHPDRVRDQLASLGLDRWCGELRVVSPDSAAEEKAEQLRSLRCRGFVGDTESDAEAAELAGVPFAAVATGQRSPRFLAALGVPVFDSLPEALRSIER
jgi:phosphoglycolate phosphatase-like HAD superfamily hydrolase